MNAIAKISAAPAVDVVPGLIANYRTAIAEHDRLFYLEDNGLDGVTAQQVFDALGPISDALIAVCAFRPASETDGALRRDFLLAELPRETDSCPDLIKAVFEALLS